MRMLDIFLFMFIFNLSLSFVNELGLFDVTFSETAMGGIAPSTYANQSMWGIATTYNSTSSGSTNVFTEIFSAFGALFKFTFTLIPKIFMMLMDGVALFPRVWLSIGMPSVLVWFLAPIVYIVNALGLYQLITGRSFREAQ